ncbi:YsnF/AvaK domain-containing protein [Anaeromyxobacter paludicola]|uniref:DUF2382 domain-containing protein n=1 Tax=Anaeromyxobacter paludicola TaxID=2918171 RepID=A0ABM7X9Z2_9BACT|nr:YsnF/AvaK domain-containing protein [Anaeromyxobacter paludicola]BDG08674.1 hypothetical protein AMPC_17870 [Anaeromyxobacter paludicola]
MLTDRSQIREGMTVYSSDGEKLGKVLACSTATFTIEKGFFFPKDYVARYEEIVDASGDEIRLALTKDAFERLRESGDYGAIASGAAETTSSGIGTASRTTGEDVRVPVAEEQVDVLKRERDAGEVRLRKDVVTETKHIDVPVTREEVRVERVPVTEPRDARPGEATFEKESVSMPVREEEVEIRKRPVVKEEVRLRKERVTEQRAAEADVRKERVDVEDESGRIRDPGTGLPRRDEDI